MNLFDYKPVVAVPRETIEKKIKELEDVINTLNKELDNRGPEEVKKYGFNTIVDRKPGVLTMGYAYYDTLQEAHEAFCKENPDIDSYTAWYRIHHVYVTKT